MTMENETNEIPEYLVVSREQLSNGYFEKIGSLIIQKSYRVIKKLDDGAFVVRNPQPQGRRLF